MGKNSLRLRPLSSAELKEKLQVTQGFGNVSSHVHLPLDGSVSLATIKGLVDEAASFAILIKQFLEKTKTGGKPVRLIPGNGREYLRNLETFPASSNDFVKNLVHATFSTKTGYVGKVSKEELDRLIDKLVAGKTRKNAIPNDELKRIEKLVRENWGEASQLMAQILSFFDQTSFSNPEYASLLNRLLHVIQTAKQEASTFHQRIVVDMREAHEEAHDDSHSEGSAETDREDEPQQRQLSVEEEKSQQPKESEIKVTNDDLEPPKPSAAEAPAPEAQASSPSPSPAPAASASAPADPNATKILRIASDVGHIGEEIQSISQNVQVLNVEDLISKPSEGKKFVADLQHRCLAFSESLMKDLYTLDELALKQEDRPKRKEQVQRIQSMVADVDSLTAKLHDLAEIMKAEEQKRQAEEQKRQGEELPSAPTPTPTQPEEPQRASSPREAGPEGSQSELQLKRQQDLDAEEAAQKRLRAELELEFQKRKEEFEAKLTDQSIRLEGLWRRMKLRPKMNVEEAIDGYLITSYIPGMNKEDIFISTSPDPRNPVLSIRGHRSPSLEELALIRRQLARSGIQPTDDAILRLGAGRFGTFLEKFSIPRDVNPAEIAGGYEGGELKVILPKLRAQPLRRPAPQPYFDPREFWF